MTAPEPGAPIPAQGPAVPPSAPPPRGRKHPERLPWTLVVILGVAVVALLALVAIREREIGELTGRLDAAQAPSATATPPVASPSSPQATANPELDALMLSLQRRDPKDARALGAVDAPVVLIDWSDFRCPYCAHWANTTFTELLPYVTSGSLRIEFRDLALFGEQSELTAVASRAAGQQGKFWEFSHAVFAAAPPSGHPDITREDLISFAKEAKVPDLAAFTKALDDEKLLADVRQESQEAQSLGISGTPFFIVNTTVISGAQPLETFVSTIEGYGGKK